MIKILKYIALIILAIFIILGVVGLFLPGTQHVERQISIAAPADKVFVYLNDFRKFNLWSPWARVDPDTKYTYSGAEQGVGAKFEWSSENPHVGKGTQEIIESVPNTFLKTELNFGDNSPAKASFSLLEEDGKTSVIWGFDAYLDNTIARYFGLMLDEWVGADYQKGLENLKILAEAQ